ncbi:MAG: hypothetical protein ACOVP4_03600 [Bacteriovoracaceae bacterium]
MTLNQSIKFLKISSLLTILTGLVSSLASSVLTQKPWLLLFDLLTWPLDGSPANFSSEAFALNAVLGGVMIGWGVLMFYVSDELPRSPKLVKGFFISLICWFVSDSIGSYVSGIYGNIILNVLFLLLFIVPLFNLLLCRQK